MITLLLYGLLNENINLFYLINGINNSILNFILPIITNLGTIYSWSLICIILYIFGGAYGKKVAILGLIAIFLTDALIILIKYIAAEPRPFLVLSNVNLLAIANDNSFPSGHTAVSFAAATLIGLKYHDKSNGKKYWLIYPLILLAILIGFSRIYIGVHYPYDVIFGAIMGILCSLLILRFENKILYSETSRRMGINRVLNFNFLKKK